jgi:hypothetical protein
MALWYRFGSLLQLERGWGEVSNFARALHFLSEGRISFRYN